MAKGLLAYGAGYRMKRWIRHGSKGRDDEEAVEAEAASLLLPLRHRDGTV